MEYYDDGAEKDIQEYESDPLNQYEYDPGSRYDAEIQNDLREWEMDAKFDELCEQDPYCSGRGDYDTNQYAPSLSTGNSSKCPYGCSIPPAGCNIKANISFETGEKIFHVPGQKYYLQTKINPDYGERWFCTQQEAINNGWRKSRE